MSSPPTSPSLVVSPRLAHAFGGIWRLTFRRFFAPGQWLPVLVGLVVLGLIATSTIRQGRIGSYYSWATEFYLSFLVPVLAFLSGGGAIRDDLKSGTVDYVLTRPVSRPAFMVFRFLSHLACIQCFFLLGLAVIGGVGVYRQIPSLSHTLPWLLLGQVMTVTAFAALGFLCGTLTGRYLVIGLFYGALIEGGIGNIPIQLNRLSMTHQIKAMFTTILPGPQMGAVPEQAHVVTVAILLAYAAVMLVLAAAVFSFRELAGARPSDN